MKARFLIPIGIFGAMVALFYFALTQMNKGEYNPRDIPSPLIGKAAPQFNLPRLLEPGKTLGTEDLKKHGVVLFNVWASWCVACRQEHPYLVELTKQKAVPIYGLNYKDERADGIGWLDRHGNPYLASAFDYDGKVGIDWGVYGVPETFVVDGKGIIRYKQIGPITPEAWQEKLLPIIEKIRAEKG